MPEQKEKEASCVFVTIGSRTGPVTHVPTKVRINGLGLARVGDVVTYDDGSEVAIIDGAGVAAVYADQQLAVVGSLLGNGDRIVELSQDRAVIVVPHGKGPEGLFDPGYVAPAFTAEGA